MEQALGEFLRHLGLEKNGSEFTLQPYPHAVTQALASFRERLGSSSVAPERVTTRLVRAFVAWLSEQGYAKTTTARRLAALRSLFRFMCRQGMLTVNPADGLRAPRQDQKLPHFLSGDD